jgi:hypothetical protein
LIPFLIAKVVGFGSKVWLYAAMAAVAVATVLVIVAQIKRGARAEDRVKALNKAMEALRVKAQTSAAVARLPDAALDGELRGWTRRR